MGHQGRPQRRSEGKLEEIPGLCRWRLHHRRHPRSEMRDGFRKGESLNRDRSGSQPQRRRGLVLAGGRIVVGQQFRRIVAGFGPAIFQQARNIGVQLSAPALEERIVSGVLNEGVGEREDRIRNLAVAGGQPRCRQKPQSGFQRLHLHQFETGDELVAEFATNDGADLGDLLGCRRPGQDAPSASCAAFLAARSRLIRPNRRSDRRRELSSPDSRIPLVSSSRNSGTPSALATI